MVADDGRELVGGRAVLFALREIGWHPWLMRTGQLPPFAWLVELGYRVVAGNRPFFHRLLFRSGDEAP